jgi:hypothetical protein
MAMVLGRNFGKWCPTIPLCIRNDRPSRLPLAVRWMSLPATFPTQSHVEFEEFDALRELFGGSGRRVWIGEIGRAELDQRLDS